MSGENNRILELEKKFWDAMVAKDAETAAGMIADPSMVVGPMGTMKMDPLTYKKMTTEGDWTLKTYDLDDVSVVFPNDSTAVIGYKVHQKGEMKGKPMDLRCADSTVWVRDGSEWKIALHSETILEDARQPELA